MTLKHKLLAAVAAVTIGFASFAALLIIWSTMIRRVPSSAQMDLVGCAVVSGVGILTAVLIPILTYRRLLGWMMRRRGVIEEKPHD